MQKVFAVLALAALAVACQDQPTAPSADPSLDPSLHQTHGRDIPRPKGHGWSLLVFEENAVYPGGPIPCLSTATEEVTHDWYGSWYWWMKDYEKTWLRGRPMHNQVLLGRANYLLDSKGRRWDFVENDQTILVTRTSMQGTAWTGTNPSTETYVNRRTGERLVFRALYLLGGDHLPPPLEYTLFEVVESSCEVVQPHHHHR
jgi:hypothetical protein